MKRVSYSFLVPLIVGLQAHASVVYTQPHTGGGGFYQSSWWDPDGSDYDQLTWDSFKLTNTTAITEIQWRGTFDPSHFGMGGPVVDFTVAIYGDIANGYQPNITAPPLIRYQVGGNAGQTPAGMFGGVTMYDYSFTLPSPFQAAANSNYWVLIEGWQHGIPDWALALGTGGNGSCFRRTAGMADMRFYTASGETAFNLLDSGAPSFLISASASPTDAGTVSGTGAYPSNSTVTLVATPNPGFGVVNWTENGAPVSTSPNYTFTAVSNRTLIANFTPAFTIATSPWPAADGSTAGDGTYLSNATVTVTATASVGYAFANWTEFGTLVSTSASYTFSATTDRVLMGNFNPVAATATFDFDTGTPPVVPHQGMPGSQSNDSMTASFTSAGAWSIQDYVFPTWLPMSFSGNFLFPPSPSGSSLQIQFDKPITNINLNFCTADLAADVDTPTLIRLTAYTNSTGTPSIGAVSLRGAWLSGSYPEGRLNFGSTTPFNLVSLDIPPAQGAMATTLFFVDNIIVQWAAPPNCHITASVWPPNSGTITGDGLFPHGATVDLLATPQPGYAFLNWTDSGAQVSTVPNYTFTAIADAFPVAYFIPWLDIQHTATNSVVLSWPATADGYLLHENTGLSTTNWFPTTNAVNVMGSKKEVIFSPLTGNTFFRLIQP